MEIEFVNHSSFVTEAGGVRLICDPWIEGRAFNHGWDLISKTRFGYDDFGRVSHIWFSHEHPDHFVPPNLRQIPEPIRQQITVLYQTTRDRKVARYCEKLGFGGVTELPAERWIELAPDYRVICGSMDNGDSWLAIRAGERTLLNLNDCCVHSPELARPIRELVGPVDVLATQFSLSSWEGNPEEVVRRRQGAKWTLDRCIFQTNFFEASYLLPFASFVWFCHEENYYMNAEHNRVDRVVEALARDTSTHPVVLYPGDRWTVGAEHDSAPAIARHVADFENLVSKERVRARQHSEAELIEAANAFVTSMTEHASRRRVDLGLAAIDARRILERLQRRRQPADAITLGRTLLTLRPRPVRIHLWDADRAYLFDLEDGLRSCSLGREECDICLGTESLVYAFKFLWGGESLQVNGRYSELYPDAAQRLFDYFHLAEAFNRGVRFAEPRLLQRLKRVLQERLQA